MSEDYFPDTKAPFNMAIATLMSLRYTLDKIRDIEGRIDYPPEERQRIKIELVKRFFVDSSPLLGEKETQSFEVILDIEPNEVVMVDRSTQKQRRVTIYSPEINKRLDKFLLDLQVALQKHNYYMPPKDDIRKAASRFSH